MASLPRRLDKLENDLANLPPEYDAMSLGELDGFIAGVLACPVEIEPEEWLAHVWRDVGEDGVTALDKAPLDALAPDILDHYRRVFLELKAAEDGYMPIFYTDSEDGSTIWEPWAAGFGEAMHMRMDTWSLITEGRDQEAIAALGGLMALISVSQGHTVAELLEVEPDADFEGMIAEAPDLLPVWTEILFDWRLAHRPEPIQAPVRVVQIGRNDPCPCGSGKKYKKCCGANQAA